MSCLAYSSVSFSGRLTKAVGGQHGRVKAREVLNKENELLEEATKRTSTFAQNLPGLQADIINDWAAYFRGWQKVNEDLIGKADSATDDELKMEMKRLEGMRNSVTGDSASAKYWRQVLDEDIEIANRLL